jgi:branched-chain amino acid transport system permease protein
VSLWLLLAVNSITLGGLLFLLSAGFSLIFGLMRIPNLTHGSFFMLGAYLATSLIAHGFGFWPAAVVAGIGVAVFGGVVERLILRRLAGAELAQVLVTLGLSFMVADVCLMVWTGDPIRIDTPAGLRGTTAVMGFGFPYLPPRHQRHRHRLRRGSLAAPRPHPARGDDSRGRGRPGDGAGGRHPRVPPVHDRLLPRRVAGGLRRGHGRAHPFRLPRPRRRDAPLALVVVILGGSGSLVGSLVGSFIVGFLYNFGQAMFPEIAYVVLFLPMLIVLVVRPQGLFGRQPA